MRVTERVEAERAAFARVRVRSYRSLVQSKYIRHGILTALFNILRIALRTALN